MTDRVRDLRDAARFLLGCAFAAMMLGAITLALRSPGNELEFAFALLALVVSMLLALIAVGLWLRARSLDQSTMIVLGNRRVADDEWVADDEPDDDGYQWFKRKE